MAQTSLSNNHSIQSTLYQNACRLNRVLILSAMLLCGLAFIQHPVKLSIEFQGVAIGLCGLSILAAFGLNEMIYHTSKRLKDTPLKRLTPYVYLLYYSFSVFLIAGTVLTQSPALPLYSAIFAIQAQCFKKPYLASQLYFVAVLLVLNMGSAIGHAPGTHMVFNSLGLLQIVTIIGTCWALGHYLSQFFHNQSQQVEALQSMATTDALTRLVNRRQFNARLNSEVSRARRHHSALSLALFDIDNFKHLNDHYGHPVGDRILQELGHLISSNVRESDVAARYGGEEFALILPETREKEASDLLERLRQLISETVFCLPENPITLTVSIGVAELNARHNNVFELIERTDQALYQAKGQGKNRVYTASQGIFPLPLIK